MNKILMPALLVATVMVAGMFAFAPVEQASTVHTSSATTENSIKYVTVTATCNVTASDVDDCDELLLNVGTGDIYSVISGTITATEAGAGAGVDINFTACTAGADDATVLDIILDSGAVGDGATATVNDSQGADPTEFFIGTSSTSDIRCVAITTTTDDDTVVVSLVLLMNGDAAEVTVDSFDADDA